MLAELKAKRAALGESFDKLGNSTEDNWQDVKDGFEKAYKDVENSFEKLADDLEK